MTAASYSVSALRQFSRCSVCLSLCSFGSYRRIMHTNRDFFQHSTALCSIFIYFIWFNLSFNKLFIVYVWITYKVQNRFGKFVLNYILFIVSTSWLLPKLLWPTVRKRCFSDWEKLLKLEAEGLEFSNFLGLLEQLLKWKVRTIFGNRLFFNPIPTSHGLNQPI